MRLVLPRLRHDDMLLRPGGRWYGRCRRCRDIGREEIHRLWATVWVLPAILPEEGPGAGFGEFSKGRVPPRACGQGGVLLLENSPKAFAPIDTRAEVAKIGCFNSILFAHMRVICSYAR